MIGLMLQAQVFGGLSVQVDGRVMPDIGGAKPRSLMAFLLLHPGPHPRARLAGRFWPDVLDTSARGSLRSALWTIRAALDAVGGADHLVADRLGVGLDPSRERDVDALEVSRLLDAGGAASLEHALLLAAEPLLPDIPDEWVLEEQDRLRDRLIDALGALADAADARGDSARALSYSREALSRDRLRESSHRALMRRLAAAGDRGGALAAYGRCRDALAGELGVPPSAETRELAEQIRAGTTAVPATVVSPAPPRRPRTPSQPAILGRRAELARMGAAWAAATAGRGGVVTIEGPAGVGKSRLAAELLATAEEEGARVAVGHALDIEEGPPFGPWADALRQLVRATPAPPPAASWPADLARLCPAVEAAWSRHPGPSAVEPNLGRASLFEAVAETLEWAATGAPVLVVLEDLHRADPSSLALLAHVGLPLQSSAALVLVTLRSGAATDGVDRMRDALARRGGVVDEITLGRLEEKDVAAIARREAPALGPDAVAWIAELSGGNPLFALRGARAAAAGGDPEEALRDTVRAPLARLSPPARELVAGAAAAGRALTVPEAAALTGAERLDDAVAEGVAAGLLDPEAGAEVAFTHGLVRRACYGELSAGRRRAAHARLAEIGSLPRGRPPAEVAHHLRRAGDDERARAYLVAAASSARALGALDQAAGFLREAGDSAESAGATAAGGEAWLALAEIEAWRGDRPAMDAAFDRVRDALSAAGDAAGLAAALAERARWLRTTTCYPDDALRSSQEALDLLDASGVNAPEARLMALAGLAWGEAVAGDPVRGERLLAELDAMPGVVDDPVLHAELVLSRGFALVRAGHSAEARARCAEGAVLAERAGRPALALDARIGEASCAAAQGLIADVLVVLGDPPDPARTGPGLACQSWAGRAHALSRLGSHDEAVEAAEEERRIAHRFGSVELEEAAEADVGMTLLAAGRAAEALSTLERCLEGGGGRVPRAALRLAAAEAALMAGDLARAQAHLDRFPFEPVGAGDDPAGLVARLDRVTGLVRIAAGDVLAGLGHLAAAEERLKRIIEEGRRDGAAGEELLAVMLDLGRPPVAGTSDPAIELARVSEEHRQAMEAAAVAADRA